MRSQGQKGLRRSRGLRSELSLVRPAASEDGRAAACGERSRILDRHAYAEPVGESCGEAVAAAVCVLDVAGDRRRAERASRADPSAEGAGCADDEPRRRIELDRVEALTDVVAAPDERVELDVRAMQ